MARMLDKIRSMEILHSLSTEDLNDLVDEVQAEFEKTWDTLSENVRKNHPAPVNLRKFMPVIEAFNRDMEALFRKPSVANEINAGGFKAGYIPAEVSALLSSLVDLGCEPVAEAEAGEPDDLDDLL